MPIYLDGYLYAFAGRNEPDAALMAVELATGKTAWRKVPEWEETLEINGASRTISESTYRGSLLRVDGHFLTLGEHGHLLWLDLTPKGYKQLARAWLFRRPRNLDAARSQPRPALHRAEPPRRPGRHAPTPALLRPAAEK